MREATLESRVVRFCKKHNVRTFKFVSPSNRGVPDRIIIDSLGGVLFLELKAKGKRLTALQQHILLELAARRCKIGWADEFEKAVDIIRSKLHV